MRKIARDADDPQRFYLQNHWGYRSDDGGRNWQDIGAELPSTFNFPGTAHPRRGSVAYIFPLNADTARVPAEPRSRVTFELAPYGEGVTRLALTHDRCGEGADCQQVLRPAWTVAMASVLWGGAVNGPDLVPRIAMRPGEIAVAPRRRRGQHRHRATRWRLLLGYASGGMRLRPGRTRVTGGAIDS
ncbi:hypothetical protein ACH4FX_20105 [Streptomyces sp. NPDC018019]|uniref:hypothetical protein n=1 Tax=Streptomyces sp. NPDC018019 TaxID=3365030 RepID=UPI0037A59B8F